ncbi:TPA: hypothetical protein HA265_01700 [Candidatus Woesearchaeota archaeon]|nr:hypothetical protein [Candidatus Woesearchaeota archaeon]
MEINKGSKEPKTYKKASDGKKEISASFNSGDEEDEPPSLANKLLEDENEERPLGRAARDETYLTQYQGTEDTDSYSIEVGMTYGRYETADETESAAAADNYAFFENEAVDGWLDYDDWESKVMEENEARAKLLPGQRSLFLQKAA